MRASQALRHISHTCLARPSYLKLNTVLARSPAEIPGPPHVEHHVDVVSVCAHGEMEVSAFFQSLEIP